MGKMEWPAGPDLCNIFVSVIFLFVVHCHEFRMKATFYFCNFWSQNLILFIVINQSPSVWIQLNCWDFPLLISLTRVIFIYFFKNIFVELNLWILNCMLIHLPLLLFIKSWLLFRIVNEAIIAKPLFLLNTVNFFFVCIWYMYGYMFIQHSIEKKKYTWLYFHKLCIRTVGNDVLLHGASNVF